MLQVREYVDKIEGRFKPTMLGRLVTNLLSTAFDDIVQVAYTREMEDRLDRIEEGKADYQGTIRIFYQKFKSDLAAAEELMPNVKTKGCQATRRAKSVAPR